jgi:hypothetical protein
MLSGMSEVPTTNVFKRQRITGQNVMLPCRSPVDVDSLHDDAAFGQNR